MQKKRCIFRILTAGLLLLALAVPVPISAKTKDGEIKRYLVLGLDEANSNADVIILVSHDTHHHRVSILQIPRDSYFNFGGSQNKINQLYPYLLSRYHGTGAKEHALSAFRDAIAEAFGLSIPYALSLSLSSFSSAVDAIGGVAIRLNQPFSYKNEKGEMVTLPVGEHRLNGRESVAFIRNRTGYERGDLARIDVQKRFISAMFASVTNDMTPAKIASIYEIMRRGMVTDIPLSEAIASTITFVREYKSTDIFYLTLPGAPILLRGISYYVINRSASTEVLAKYALYREQVELPFDAQRRFVSEDLLIREIYDSNQIHFSVFQDREMQK